MCICKTSILFRHSNAKKNRDAKITSRRRFVTFILCDLVQLRWKVRRTIVKINVEYVFLDIRVTHTLPKDLQLSKRCPQMDFKCQMTVQIYEIFSNLKKKKKKNCPQKHYFLFSRSFLSKFLANNVFDNLLIHTIF